MSLKSVKDGKLMISSYEVKLLLDCVNHPTQMLRQQKARCTEILLDLYELVRSRAEIEKILVDISIPVPPVEGDK